MGRRNPFISKKLLAELLDDFAFVGSTPFHLIVMLVVYLLGNTLLASRLAYSFVIGLVLVISVKSMHFKERPQKEEFTIFMEKVIASSFPSTHSLLATNLAILFSITYPIPWVIALSSVLALLVYAQRYISKKHFLVDCLGGLGCSIIIVVFVVRVL